jgi:hypothetical protein
MKTCNGGAGAPSAISLDGCGGGGCGRNAPPRFPVIMDRLPADTRVRNGQECVPDLRGVQTPDPLGRHAHVAGIKVEGTYRLTVPGATNDAIEAREMLALIGDIHLEDVSGWKYLSGGIDGRSLRDDVFFRTYSLDGETEASGGLESNAGIATYDVPVSLTFPLIRNVDAKGNPQDWQGLIPLAALQARKGSFKFKAGSTALAVDGAAATGVTFTGFQGTVTVTFDLVWLPEVLFPPQWGLEHYTEDGLSGSLRYADRITEYAAVRHFGDDDGSELIDDYDGISISVGGVDLADSLSLAEHVRKDAWIIRGQHHGASGLVARFDGLGSAYLSLPMRFPSADVPGIGDPTSLQPDDANALMLVPQQRYREMMAAGRIGFRFASRTRETTRILHRTISCIDPMRVAKVLESAACGSSRDVRKVTSSGEIVKPTGGAATVVTNTKGAFSAPMQYRTGW